MSGERKCHVNPKRREEVNGEPRRVNRRTKESTYDAPVVVVIAVPSS
jgi:hypothetical protein